VIVNAPQFERETHRPRQSLREVARQLPVSDWHHLIADPSIADAVLDRLVHRSVRIELTGESMRRRGQGKDGELT